MNRIIISLALCLLSALPLSAKEEWKKVALEDGITIFNRDASGSELKEMLAVGTIDAEPWVVKNVLDDVENYKDFMPYTELSTVVSRGKNSVVSYQKLDTPLVSNREYVIEIKDLSKRQKDGSIVYLNKWKVKPGVGPAVTSDTVRIVQNSGYWELRKRKDGKTKATYYVFTDPGGSIPNFIINKANTTAVPAVFEAVRKRVKLAAYKKTKHALESKPAAPVAPAPVTPAPVAPAP